jgi:hypothetical protein
MPVAEELKPPPPPVRAKTESVLPIPPRPPSSADIVTSAAPMPKGDRPSQLPLPPRALSTPPPPVVQSEPPKLSEAAQEQVTAILRTVLESTLAPVLSKQQELEARLEALQKTPSVVRQPSSNSLQPVRSMAPSVDITGSVSTPPVRASMVSTSYGLVSVMPGPAPRPAIEEALEKVGPIDVPDFAGKRKFAGRIVIALLIVAVIGAIVATVLSYS